MADDDAYSKMRGLVGDHGMAFLERFAEQLSKLPPPTDEDRRRLSETLRARSRAMGVTDEDIAQIREELFGPPHP